MGIGWRSGKFTPMDPRETPFYTLSEYPDVVTPGTILARLVAGLGFRLRWATEGLEEDDGAFRADPEGFSIGEVLEHVGRMVVWIHHRFASAAPSGVPGSRPEAQALPALAEEHGFLERRAHCLACLAILEQDVSRLGATDLESIVIDNRHGRFPFWVLVNGPLSDALTHVGQISVWRRQAGKPAPQSNPFAGLPPG